MGLLLLLLSSLLYVWQIISYFRYTLLVGKPPFETSTLKDTYLKIKKNEYRIPSRIGTPARLLIQKLLQADPSKRPTIHNIVKDDFIVYGKLWILLQI